MSIKADPKYSLPTAMDLNKTKKIKIAGFQAFFFLSLHKTPPNLHFFNAKSGPATYNLPSHYDSLNTENTEGAFGEVIPCVQPILGPQHDNIHVLLYNMVQHLFSTIISRLHIPVATPTAYLHRL